MCCIHITYCKLLTTLCCVLGLLHGYKYVCIPPSLNVQKQTELATLFKVDMISSTRSPRLVVMHCTDCDMFREGATSCDMFQEGNTSASSDELLWHCMLQCLLLLGVQKT